MISSLLLRITSSWPVCASFSALRLLLFLIGGSNETGDPQEERLCWILTLRSAIQVRQDSEVEPDEMLSMRRQASEQSRTKRGASAGFVEIGRGDAELDEAMEGEEKDMDAQIRVRLDESVDCKEGSTLKLSTKLVGISVRMSTAARGKTRQTSWLAKVTKSDSSRGVRFQERCVQREDQVANQEKGHQQESRQ
ncbi:hypothetical protein NDA18_006239 [Ustilago nuda]|nr:hypothetical protein NDA18_006239 [Ustilago nuda]